MHLVICAQKSSPKPGSRAEYALSKGVLLNLVSAISVNKYGDNNILKDFRALLQISLNIRDDFIGPFQPFPDSLSEKINSYSKNRKFVQFIENYSQREEEIIEYISTKMSAALPYNYDRFIDFLISRPMRNMSVEPVDKFAEKLHYVHQSIVEPGGIYEQSKNLTNFFKVFKSIGQRKTEMLLTIDYLFLAIDKNNVQHYNKLNDILKSQLSILIEDINKSMQILMQLRVKDILIKLSAVHKTFFAAALEIFHDEFKQQDEVKIPTSNASDSFHREIPTSFQRLGESSKHFQNNSQLLFLFYTVAFFIVLFYILMIRRR